MRRLCQPEEANRDGRERCWLRRTLTKTGHKKASSRLRSRTYLRLVDSATFLRVVSIGAGHAHRKRNALSITDQMPFAPPLCAWDSALFFASPHTARTRQLSMMARDQSMSPSSASQFKSAKCIRSQTPSCCQSCRRHQQVIPDPQPNSFGNVFIKSRPFPRQGRSGYFSRPSDEASEQEWHSDMGRFQPTRQAHRLGHCR
jgi:hypothetical protein